MNLDQALGAVQKSVPDCLAVGVVDLTTGMLLAVKAADSHPQEGLDLMAAAAESLFESPHVEALERAYTRGDKGDDGHPFREVLLTSREAVLVFQRCEARDHTVLAVVARATSNFGLVLARARLARERVELALRAPNPR